ncbi:hypothetical protein [Cryptosporangium aurantiacum]|uniref:hypothetical protein n=1 Tax=Cryptosporangium aurantiacum TaxID=134849 RepID=UPI0031834D7D
MAFRCVNEIEKVLVRADAARRPEAECPVEVALVAITGPAGSRVRSAGFPHRTLYRLTASGRALEPLLVELYRTGAALLDQAGVPS